MMALSNHKQNNIAVGKTSQSAESISFQTSINILAIDPISSMRKDITSEYAVWQHLSKVPPY